MCFLIVCPSWGDVRACGGVKVTCDCRTVESSDVVKSIPAGVGRLRSSGDVGIISRGGTAGGEEGSSSDKEWCWAY